MFYQAYYKDFQPKIYFNFFIFVRTNSHKVVVFCGWSLNISEYKLIPSNRSFVLTLVKEKLCFRVYIIHVDGKLPA